MGQNRSAAAENIAQSITRQGGTVASAGWYIVENRGTYAGNPNALYPAGANCVDDTSNAVRIVRGEPVLSGGTEVMVPEMPDLLAVYCSELDGIGHRAGPDSPEIAAALGMLDQQLSRLVQATKDTGVYDRTTFILVSDTA